LHRAQQQQRALAGGGTHAAVSQRGLACGFDMELRMCIAFALGAVLGFVCLPAGEPCG
jgi:hypothetical protein